MPARCRSISPRPHRCARSDARHGMPVEASHRARTGAYRRLLRYAAPYRWGWAAIVAAMLLSTALSLAQPWPLQILVDHVIGNVAMRGGLAAIVAVLPAADSTSGLLGWVVAA